MNRYKIGPVPAQIEPELVSGFSDVEIATIGHFRHRGFMRKDLRPILQPEGLVAGTAFTVAIPATDSTLLHHAISLLRPGDVLVIDRLGDTRHACLGGGVAFAAKTAGAVAVVLDGPCTDHDEIIEEGMTVYCTGISPITTRLNDLGGAINVPVSCGGVPVLPGDLVLMDPCGVLVLPADEAPDVLAEAKERQARAGRFRGRIEKGEKLGDLSGASAKISAAMDEN
ncbi:RraA family protein [Paracoccus albus]|uniref:RraA family protein n=1 Tax=Paracoccus albus TaxID=3017784 RepID=UPI0022F05045|nr:RraA family protein [Paracoccus albus]WBU60989.1 RraA family protein [Paracoccus albus]